MRTIIRLERKSWGGRGEHGFINATIVQKNKRWEVQFLSEDYNDWGATSKLTNITKKVVALQADYFEIYSAEDFRLLLSHMGYYRISEEELLAAVPFCQKRPRVYEEKCFSNLLGDLSVYGILWVKEEQQRM